MDYSTRSSMKRSPSTVAVVLIGWTRLGLDQASLLRSQNAPLP